MEGGVREKKEVEGETVSDRHRAVAVPLPTLETTVSLHILQH